MLAALPTTEYLRWVAYRSYRNKAAVRLSKGGKQSGAIWSDW